MADDIGPHGAWSRTDTLLAGALDALMSLIHVQVRKSGGDMDPPTPIRRPGVVPHSRAASPQGLAYLQRIRDLHAQQPEEGP